MSNIQQTLNERGKNYGSFEDVAITTDQLKDAMLKALEKNKLSAVTPVQWESLSQISTKIARAVNGNVDYVDNWRDIAGYALLVVEYLEKQGEKNESKNK
ncbi:hypothetical protein A4G19_08480 [Pasteurellaceae bacterium Macca]|nr:hypothetical protein [Pasteurellaceae bacterium Macca]